MSLHEASSLSLVNYAPLDRRVFQKIFNLQCISTPIGGKILPFSIFGFSETAKAPWDNYYITIYALVDDYTNEFK